MRTWLAALVIALAVTTGRLAAQEPVPERPNFVVIFVDDLGWGDLASYGHPTIRTPNLDRMADQGMRFTQFYVAASVCTPSRAGLLTGRYPIRTGMVAGRGLPGRVLFPGDEEGLPPSEVTVPEVLAPAGYTSAAIGKWHLGDHRPFLPTDQGFDRYFGIPYSNDMDHVRGAEGAEGYWNVPVLRDTAVVERPADQTTITRRYTEEAVRFIEESAGSGRPFFLYLAHSMPHIPLFTSSAFRAVSPRGLYGDVVEELDWSVGRVLEALADAGVDERTLVIFTSDNGPWLVQDQEGGSAGPLRDGKGTTWEGGMRVPMIARWPGTIPAGRTSYAVASTLDILPTLAALGGAPLPDRVLDGSDLSAVLRGDTDRHADFFGYFRRDALFAARMGPWKAHFLTQTAYGPGELAVHDPPRLYNLEHDPGERFDVAGQHPDVLAQIAARAAALRESVGSGAGPSIEAEDLLAAAAVTGGRLEVQDMASFRGDWGGDAQLWWIEGRPGDRMSLPIEVPEAGAYELLGFFTRAGDYGIVRLHVGGVALSPLMDGYAPRVEPTGEVSFGRVELEAGTNELVVELLGGDERASGSSDGYRVGIDGFRLRPVGR